MHVSQRLLHPRFHLNRRKKKENEQRQRPQDMYIVQVLLDLRAYQPNSNNKITASKSYDQIELTASSDIDSPTRIKKKSVEQSRSMSDLARIDQHDYALHI